MEGHVNTDSALVGKTNREVVLGTRGAIHIAHPLAPLTLCGKQIGERLGVDAFGRGGIHNGVHVYGFNACRDCVVSTYAGGNEARQ